MNLFVCNSPPLPSYPPLCIYPALSNSVCLVAVHRGLLPAQALVQQAGRHRSGADSPDEPRPRHVPGAPGEQAVPRRQRRTGGEHGLLPAGAGG